MGSRQQIVMRQALQQAIIWIMAALVLTLDLHTGVAAQHAQELALLRQQNRLYLVKKQARLLLCEPCPSFEAKKTRSLLRNVTVWLPTLQTRRQFSLPGGYTIALPTGLGNFGHEMITFQHRDQQVEQISLQERLKQWLKADKLWRDPATVRESYQDEGLTAYMDNAVVFDRTVFAVLTWTANGGHGEAIASQQLVRIRPTSEPKLEVLRPLDTPDFGWRHQYSPHPCLRLIAFGKRLLLYTHVGDPTEGMNQRSSQLEEITANGKTIRRYARLPSLFYPIGLVNARWLLLSVADIREVYPVRVFDLQQKKLRRLPGDWKGYYTSSDLYVPPAGQSILIDGPMTTDARANKGYVTTYIVHIPDGRTVRLPPRDAGLYGLTYGLWKGLVIVVGSPQNQVSIYDATTGHLVRQFATDLHGMHGPSSSKITYTPEFEFGTQGIEIGQFLYPTSVAVMPSGNIIVADTKNNRVQVFDKFGHFQFFLGLPGSKEGEFDTPYGVAAGPSGNIVVADTNNNRIQVFDMSGRFLFAFGKEGSGEGQFLQPDSVAVTPSGNMVVSDIGDNRVQVFDKAGRFLFAFGSKGEGRLLAPRAVAVDRQSHILVTDAGDNQVKIFDSRGRFRSAFGTPGGRPGEFNGSWGVAVLPEGRIVVADRLNNRIQVFSSQGQFQFAFGSKGSEAGQFVEPYAVAIDASGRMSNAVQN